MVAGVGRSALNALLERIGRGLPVEELYKLAAAWQQDGTRVAAVTAANKVAVAHDRIDRMRDARGAASVASKKLDDSILQDITSKWGERDDISLRARIAAMDCATALSVADLIGEEFTLAHYAVLVGPWAKVIGFPP